jgi:hypothetical protein
LVIPVPVTIRWVAANNTDWCAKAFLAADALWSPDRDVAELLNATGRQPNFDREGSAKSHIREVLDCAISSNGSPLTNDRAMVDGDQRSFCVNADIRLRQNSATASARSVFRAAN